MDEEESYIKFKDMPKLEENEKYTIFLIGNQDVMAITHRIEIKFIKAECVDEYAQYKNIAKIIFKLKGKRKLRVYRLDDDCIILKGWNIPLKIDTDFKSFKSNGLIHFVGNEAEIKKELEKAILINKEVITVASEEDTSDNKYLYPEEAMAEAL